MYFIFIIGISENTGACIAVPKKVQAFRHFFIQVELPNKVTRKEKFNVKVTVFNYFIIEQIVSTFSVIWAFELCTI